MQNSYRIIAGNFRGRKFTFPDAIGLRPTSGRIRETVFNWLQFEINNKTVLDLFGGSGALSIESLSRGAKEVYVIEKNPVVYKQLLSNLALLETNNYTLINADALNYLANQCDKSFDLVFLDPPFSTDLLPQALSLLSSNNCLNSQSKIYIESENIINEDKLGSITGYCYNIVKHKKSGKVHYCLININKL